MRSTVILSTYNQPRWLELVLTGFLVQTRRPDQVIVADDGSGPDTQAVIAAMQQHAPYPVQHVWHQDLGFRKTVILNAALALAEGDYVIFTDGDCIPTPTFVERHLQLAAPHRFLSGGYVKLPMSVCENITEESVRLRQATMPAWLRDHGMPLTPALLKLGSSLTVGRCLDAITTTRPTWNGHNASTWRDALWAANGFDERMVYGGEDRELGERLENAGIRGRQVRYRIGCVHLDHPRGYVSPEGIAANKVIREETRRSGRTTTTHSSLAGNLQQGPTV